MARSLRDRRKGRGPCVPESRQWDVRRGHAEGGYCRCPRRAQRRLRRSGSRWRSRSVARGERTANCLPEQSRRHLQRCDSELRPGRKWRRARRRVRRFRWRWADRRLHRERERSQRALPQRRRAAIQRRHGGVGPNERQRRQGGTRLLRNDGGNNNLAVDVTLRALRTGSGKNNDFGIVARLELRAGDIYETRVATTRVTHFGLVPHLKADVLRIEWPNGVPQT